jgi:RNase P/RNase MRP subunit p29
MPIEAAPDNEAFRLLDQLRVPGRQSEHFDPPQTPASCTPVPPDNDELIRHRRSRFDVQGSTFKVRVQGSRFKVRGSRFEVQVRGSRFEFKVRGSGSRFKVRGSRFEVQGSRFKVRGSRFIKIPRPLPTRTQPRQFHSFVLQLIMSS